MPHCIARYFTSAIKNFTNTYCIWRSGVQQFLLQLVNTFVITVLSMPKKSADFIPQSAFQTWFNAAIEKRGISLTLLADKVGMDYSHLWRIVRGDLQKYPSSKRPGYESTVAIGQELGDVEGALKAAGYPNVKEASGRAEVNFGMSARARVIRNGVEIDDDGNPVEALPELERIPEDVEYIVSRYSGLSEGGQELARRMIDALEKAERGEDGGEQFNPYAKGGLDGRGGKSGKSSKSSQ